jgi:hypothetical protein
LLFSFWQEPPIAEVRRIVKSVKENYWGSRPYPIMYQTPRHDRNDGWLSLDDEDTSPELSREEKKLRALEYQLHTATPDQKAFIRKGIAIARQKIEQERASDEKLLADLGESASGLVLYRGINAHQEASAGGKFYHESFEFARQFTQSGRDNEVLRVSIDPTCIYRADPLPYGGDPDELEAAVEAAQAAGFSALYADEGTAGSPSLYVFRKVTDGRPTLRVLGRGEA